MRILSLIRFHSNITGSSGDQVRSFLRNTLDMGLVDVLQGLSEMRTLHLKFGKRERSGYSQHLLHWCTDFDFLHGRLTATEVKTAYLQRIMDLLINGRSTVKADLDAGLEPILAALSAVLSGG